MARRRFRNRANRYGYNIRKPAKKSYAEELYLNAIANKSPYAMDNPVVDRLLVCLKRVDPDYFYNMALEAFNDQRPRLSFVKNTVLRETFPTVFAKFSLGARIEESYMVPDEPIEETLLHPKGAVIFIRNKNKGKLELYDEKSNFIKHIDLHVDKEHKGRCVDLYNDLLVVSFKGRGVERRYGLIQP